MNSLFLILFCISFLCIPVFVLWALINLIQKKPARKRFKLAGISVIALIVSTIGFGFTMDNIESTEPADTIIEDSVDVAESPTLQPTIVPTVNPTEIPTAQPTEAPIPERAPKPEEIKYSLLSEIELDKLQQLYLDFDSSWSYPDAVNYIISTELPYSEEKYNGSRTIQVAFTEGCTAQKYMKESGDYLTITYIYPKDENSINDELNKYNFGTCGYFPASSALQLIEHKAGYYFSIYEPGNYILGTKEEINSSITKEEQMLYYFNNK